MSMSHRICSGLATALLVFSLHATAQADALSELAPTGKLRAAINLGNPVLAQGTPQAPSGEIGRAHV